MEYVKYIRSYFLSFFCGLFFYSPNTCKKRMYGDKEYYNICRCFFCFTRTPSNEADYKGRIKYFKIWRFYICSYRIIDPIWNWIIGQDVIGYVKSYGHSNMRRQIERVNCYPRWYPGIYEKDNLGCKRFKPYSPRKYSNLEWRKIMNYENK